MATGKPLIFTGILVSANTTNVVGTGNSATFNLPDDENITITNELEEAIVEGGQTIINAFNQGIEAMTYDLNCLDTGNGVVADAIQVNTTIPSAGSIRLVGATGSANVDILNVRIAASRPFSDLRRDHAMIKATLTSTSGISVSDA